ncbi:calpain-9-like isoform X2 [Littorina saxatilis]|uniref:Calpain catalytic domain-containing protein n=1 Tax=Littorina saxatilis TaxID=31220 RepID=A0AAN9GA79_9CAEN
MADPRRQYAGTTTGLMVQFLDFRLRDDGRSMPMVPPSQLWEDTTFDLQDAIPNPQIAQRVEWKRPGEISDHPQLFTDGTTRFDIGQGEAGTCWFLSMVASIAPHTRLVKEVVPDDAYPIATRAYRGVFHARFWRFGQWEDVYVDDRLPVLKGSKQLWGAHSASDPNEFWVALLEKAFARYHGSYKAVYGGQAGDAFIALTGGVAEMLNYEEDAHKAQKTFHRIRNALNSGTFAAAAVPGKFDKVLGLVGAHAYSVTGTAVVKGVSLIRIRNPWGNMEWKGAWSDGSGEWEGVSTSEVPRAVKDEGEFWICLDDFMIYFNEPTVCSLTPDFDQDGVSDSLNFVTNVYGEWRGETAAGFQNKLKNPRFKFTVPQSGSAEVPVVVQLIQRRESRTATNLFIRCDVFKVLDQTDQNATVQILGENTNSYINGDQTSFRYTLSAGTYLTLPSTKDAEQEKSFLIRVFSSVPLSNVSEFPSNRDLITSESTTVTSGGQNFPLDFVKTVNGAWKAGVNAGGQIAHRNTHATNPQLAFSVSQMMAVEIKLSQKDDGHRIPLALCLFPTGNAPMDIDAIYSMMGKQEAVLDTEGRPYTFVGNAPEIKATYMLKPGEYTLLVHTDEPDTEKPFTVVVMSSSPVEPRAYQTGL